jgi:hypothetical protein
VAVHGNQVLVGARGKNAFMGKAYLFNASTGALLRELTPTVFGQFGRAVALNGKWAAIGAAREGGGGAVYLYNLVSGAAPERIGPYDANNDAFGSSLALAGDLIIIGDPENDSGGINSGAVHVYNALTRGHVRTVARSGDFLRYGTSVDASGGKVLIGTWRSNPAAFLMDLATDAELSFSYSGANPSMGNSVALQGNLAIIGAPGHDLPDEDSGSAFCYDARTGQLLYQIAPPDVTAFDNFGHQVALSGNLAVCSALDDDLGTDAGAVYFVRPVSSPIPLTTRAKIGDYAPGVPQADFSTFKAAYMDDLGSIFVHAGLRGPASNGGTDTGIWSTLGPRRFELVLKSRQDLSFFGTPDGQSYIGLRVGAISSPVLNNPAAGLFQVTLAGAGVTSTNNRVLVRDNGTGAARPVLRTDKAIGHGFAVGNPSWNGARLGSMLRVAQGSVGDNIIVACALRTGVAGTTNADDSGILVMDHLGNVQNTFLREGHDSPDGRFGQFAGTTAAGSTDFFAFRAALLPTGQAAKQAVLIAYSQGISTAIGVQGDVPEQVGGAKYASFSGKSLVDNFACWRATLSGTGVTTLNNQSLWNESKGLMVRTGDEIEPGLFVSRIEKYWGMNQGDDTTQYAVIQVMLRGTGVTTANNRALYLWHKVGAISAYQRLMRSGDPAEGCGAVRIGVIQRVAVHPTGDYAILASLTGMPFLPTRRFSWETRVLGPTPSSGEYCDSPI